MTCCKTIFPVYFSLYSIYKPLNSGCDFKHTCSRPVLTTQPRNPSGSASHSVRPSSSLHLHLLCVWKKSINNIASYTMRNILIQMGLWGFVFDEGTCFNSSFPVYFVFFKPMFDQKAKYQSSGAGRIVPTCWRWPCIFHVYCLDFNCVWYPT